MVIDDSNCPSERNFNLKMTPPLQHLEGVQGLQQTIQLILYWVILKGVQGLSARNMPHFVNIMLLSLL
jgi:hypothetical protein